MNRIYPDTARLLTRVAPLVLVNDTFALKGGTAINLFVRDIPRLSVDLDLVFPGYMQPRDEALRNASSWASRMWSSFQACDGSCKTWSGCAKPMRGNSRKKQMSLRGGWHRPRG